jgi:DNA-binding NarL/FixJ family response regulator
MKLLMSEIRVAIVEDCIDEREALFYLINGTAGFCCVGALSSGEEALAKLPPATPDVILMDIGLPGISGIDCIRAFRTSLPKARIMMLTVLADHDRIFQALRAGASGYLLKGTAPAKLLEAVQELHGGGAPMSAPIAREVIAAFHEPRPAVESAQLTQRENEILSLLALGCPYKEIADRLVIHIGTVRTHIARIYDKLHVHSRHEAVLKSVQRKN